MVSLLGNRELLFIEKVVRFSIIAFLVVPILGSGSQNPAFEYLMLMMAGALTGTSINLDDSCTTDSHRVTATGLIVSGYIIWFLSDPITLRLYPGLFFFVFSFCEFHSRIDRRTVFLSRIVIWGMIAIALFLPLEPDFKLLIIPILFSGVGFISCFIFFKDVGIGLSKSLVPTLFLLIGAAFAVFFGRIEVPLAIVFENVDLDGFLDRYRFLVYLSGVFIFIYSTRLQSIGGSVDHPGIAEWIFVFCLVLGAGIGLVLLENSFSYFSLQDLLVCASFALMALNTVLGAYLVRDGKFLIRLLVLSNGAVFACVAFYFAQNLALSMFVSSVQVFVVYLWFTSKEGHQN